jgi:prophage antirepressor-like protein
MLIVTGINVYRSDVLGAELRTVHLDGQSLVSAEDLAKALGYNRTEYLTRHLRDRHMVDVARKDLGLNPGKPIRYVTEQGLYAATLRAETGNAEAFQDWVTDEVLPAIKRDGGYLAPDRTAEQNARLSERVQYRAVRDAIAGATDYDASDPEVRALFARVQNLFHLAVTGQTARQLTSSRDIQRWTGKNQATKLDLSIAKNYLTEDELTIYTGLGDLVLARVRLTWPKGGHELAGVHLAVREALVFAKSVGAVGPDVSIEL